MSGSLRNIKAPAGYLLGLLFCLSPWSSPGAALALGLLFALACGNPWRDQGSRYVRWLLQASVVLLGFDMDFMAVLRTGAHGLLFAAVTILGTLTLGWLLARSLYIGRKTSLLISAGTAICGGSAIAAVGTAVDADKGEMSVAMGAVFLLNTLALYLFPLLGHLLHLAPAQFGIWAGVAIHDVSSVVGAASAYGGDALSIATVVKLSRVLWIVPLTLSAAWWFHRSDAAAGVPAKRPAPPWFIGGFLLASLLAGWVPLLGAWAPALTRVARLGFSFTLFCIGAGLSREALKAVGLRPLLQAFLLWVFIGGVSLAVVLAGAA